MPGFRRHPQPSSAKIDHRIGQPPFIDAERGIGQTVCKALEFIPSKSQVRITNPSSELGCVEQRGLVDAHQCAPAADDGRRGFG
jgi:hypothetical protein